MALTQIPASTFLIWFLLIVLIAVYVLLIVRQYRVLKVRGDHNHTIELTNQGNLPSVYHLSVTCPEPQLKFELLHNNVPLIDTPEPKMKIEPTAVPQTKPEKKKKKDRPKKKSKAGPPPAPSKVSQASRSGQQVAAKAGVAASFLGTLGGLLPGKLGSKLKAQGSVVREAQTKTMKTVQAPTQIQRKADALKRDSNRLGVKTPAGAEPGNAPRQVETQASAASQAHTIETVQVEQPKVIHHRRVQTREVYPGATLLLTLRIGSKKRRYPSGSFTYTVQSKQVPIDPIKIEPPLVTKHGLVYFKPIAGWRYWMPLFGSLAIVVLTLLAIYYYLAVMW